MSGSGSSPPRIIVMMAKGRPVAVFRDHEAAVAWLRDHLSEIEVVYSIAEGAPPEGVAAEDRSLTSLVTHVPSPGKDGESSSGM